MTDAPALWLPAKRAAFKIGPAPTPKPGPGEILVRVRAVAVNPVDRMIPAVGEFIFPWLRYPAVLGTDVAGEVVEVGEGVQRFSPGARVLGHAVGLDKARNRAAEGAFQTFCLLVEHMAAPIPQTLSFERAAVLPLALSTAACGLYQSDELGLDPPSASPTPKNQVVLVWGGSTSVGINAVQLAVASGYAVLATASPKNFELLRRLGAEQTFDYADAGAAAQILKALAGRELAGALAVGAGSGDACLNVLGASRGPRRMALATPPGRFDEIPAKGPRLRKLAPALAGMALGNLSLAAKVRRFKVRSKFIWGSSLVSDDVGPMIYERYLPAALAEDRHKALPEPLVFGEGLDRIPAAIDRLGQGVSAQKVVVRL